MLLILFNLFLGLELIIVLCNVDRVPFIHNYICHIDTSNGILKYKFLCLSLMACFISHMNSFGEVTILSLEKEDGCSNFPFTFVSLASCSSRNITLWSLPLMVEVLQKYLVFPSIQFFVEQKKHRRTIFVKYYV
jgi:hypothetical protein